MEYAYHCSTGEKAAERSVKGHFQLHTEFKASLCDMKLNGRWEVGDGSDRFHSFSMIVQISSENIIPTDQE